MRNVSYDDNAEKDEQNTSDEDVNGDRDPKPVHKRMMMLASQKK
jgi:hypothetical protein